MPNIGQKLDIEHLIPQHDSLSRNERQKLLQLYSTPIIARRDFLAQGDWLNDKQVVQLKDNLGSKYNYMGFKMEKNWYLYPEEALFLLHIGVLEILKSKVALSVQESYSVLLPNKLSVNCYHLYLHLTKLGYKLCRQILTEEYFPDSSNDNDNVNCENPSLIEKEEKLSEISKFSNFPVKDIISSDKERSQTQFITHNSSHCFSPKAEGIELNFPVELLLPEDCSPRRQISCNLNSMLHLKCVKKWKTRIQNSEFNIENYPSCLIPSVAEKSTNWDDYNKHLLQIDEDQILQNSYMGILWRGKTKPLIRPNQISSLECLSSELHLSPIVSQIPVKKSTPTSSFFCEHNKTQPIMIYNLYLPATKLKLKQMPQPDLLFAIPRNGEFPKARDLIQLTQTNQRIVLGAVVGGQIRMYRLINTSLVPFNACKESAI